MAEAMKLFLNLKDCRMEKPNYYASETLIEYVTEEGKWK